MATITTMLKDGSISAIEQRVFMKRLNGFLRSQDGQSAIGTELRRRVIKWWQNYFKEKSDFNEAEFMVHLPHCIRKELTEVTTKSVLASTCTTLNV